MGGKRFRAAVAAVVASALGAAGMVAAGVGGTAPAGAATVTPATAYWAIGSKGQAVPFHSVSFGDMSTTPLTGRIVGAAIAPDGHGYWMASSDGGVFSFGSAGYHGSEGHQSLPAPIVAIAANPTNGGYWLAGTRGSIYGFGTPTFGSAEAWALFSPIVGMAATPDGKGYWLVASNGGVFSFGTAGFYGSMGGKKLKAPIVAIAPSPSGKGYWLVSSDGGVFSFGTGFYGSMGGRAIAAPVTGISPSPNGGGYWLVGRNGAVYAFGNAPFLGAAHTAMGSTPTVALISTATALVYPHNSTGYDVSQWDCPSYVGKTYPSGAHGFGVAQVSGGAIDKYQPAGCYAQEAAWAGPNEMAYIFMDPLPAPQAAKSMSGPAGNCAATDLSCQNYNYGYNWAVTWVNYAHAQGTSPLMFFLDVEAGGWKYDSASQVDNSREVSGAINGLKAAGQVPGIYSTNYQFQLITGGHVSSPGIAVWMAGASSPAQAQAFCSNSNGYNYQAFAGGKIMMTQWVTQYDQDYACP